MKKFLTAALCLASLTAFGKGRIQNEDVKSLSEIESSVLTITGNISSSSPCITSPSSTSKLGVGQFVYDSTTPGNITAGVTIAGLPGSCSAGQIQMSSNANAIATGDTITFGGQPSQLINDTKLWVSSITPPQQLSSAITTGALGGSGGGSKNYLTKYIASTSGGTTNTGNGDLETGTATGWSLGTLGVSANGLPIGTPSFGSGADSHLSISTITSGSLQKKYSLSYASSTATVQGNMLASDAFWIDSEDQAKVLTYKVYYNVHSGAANDDFSGTSTNSFAVAVYDVTNSAFIAVSPAFAFAQNSGIGYVTGVFQTGITTTQLRFIVYNANASSGATTVYFDDFSLGPQTAPYGPALTDCVPYAPTFVGLGTPTGVNFCSRRVGDSLEIFGSLTTGTTTGATSSFSIGYNGANANVSLNTGLLTSLTQVFGNAGYGGNTTNTIWIIGNNTNTTTLNFGVASSGTSNLTPAIGTVTSGNGTAIALYAKVPIAGWSSNSQMSSDNASRVISFNGIMPNQAVNSGTDIPMAAGVDRSASWNGTQFVVPVAGDYSTTGAIPTNAPTTLAVYKNGSLFANYASQNTSAGYTGGGALVTNCVPGDLISWRTNSSINSVGGGQFSIFRLAGPPVSAVTESVNMTANAYTSITMNNSTPTKFSTVVRDTHSGYSPSTGQYTVRVSGQYRVTGVLGGTALGSNTDAVYKNGVDICEGVFSGSVTSYVVTCEYPFLAGDTIDIRWNGGTVTESATGAQSYFNVSRIGN